MPGSEVTARKPLVLWADERAARLLACLRIDCHSGPMVGMGEVSVGRGGRWNPVANLSRVLLQRSKYVYGTAALWKEPTDAFPHVFWRVRGTLHESRKQPSRNTTSIRMRVQLPLVVGQRGVSLFR